MEHKITKAVLEKYIKRHIEKYNKLGLYSVLSSTEFQQIFKKVNDIKLLIEEIKNYKENDSKPYIPLELGIYFDKLLSSGNVSFCLNRAYYGENAIEDPSFVGIMKNGLKNMGAEAQTVSTVKASLTQNLDICSGARMFYILARKPRNCSTGTLIYTIPKEYIESDKSHNDGNVKAEYEDKVYQIKNGIKYVRPEFILGYLDHSTGICNLFTREELLKMINEQELKGKSI